MKIMIASDIHGSAYYCVSRLLPLIIYGIQAFRYEVCHNSMPFSIEVNAVQRKFAASG